MKNSCAFVLAVVAGIGCGLCYADGAAMRFKLNIEPQPLGSALMAFGEQSGVQVLMKIEDGAVERARAPRLVGEFTAQGALDRLLRDSGLRYEFVNDRTVRVSIAEESVAAPRMQEWRVAQSPPAAQGAQQATNDPSSQGREGSAEISEIIVTAQKRAERLIDVPQSVTVLLADDLTRTGALQFRDFANSVPGLTFSTAGAGFTQISLRGVTAGLDVGPTVRVYVDEVPYGASGASAFTRGERLALDVGLFDMDRIEVLKGPQGTLYGASSMGGVVKYVTRRPDSSSFGINAQTGMSSTQDGGIGYNGAATLNAPIAAGKAAVRVSGFYAHDGGFIDNVARAREDIDRSDVYGGRFDLLLTPSDALDVRITGFAQDVSRDGMGTVDFSRTGVPLFGERIQSRVFDEPFDQRFRLVSATLTYKLSGASLTSVSSYQTVRSEIFYDLSALATAYGPFSAMGFPERLTTDKFTQEVRLAGERRGPFEWLFGGFYTREHSKRTRLLQPRDLAGQPVPTTTFTSLSITPTRYEEYSAFGDLTWYLTSSFDVTGGVRYARNRQTAEQNGFGSFITPFPESPSKESVATYLANMRYRFNDRATAYVRYATGYRPGGPNFILLDPTTGLPASPPTFEADRLKSTEIGLKSETADRRFGIDLAAYNIDWANMQAFDLRSQFGGLTNVHGATLRGAELALTVRPVSALTMTGAFTYQDAKLSAAAPSLQAADGERLPNVPRETAALNADYVFGEQGLRPTIGATVRYMGERRSNFGPRGFSLPEYTTVDLRAGLTIGSVNAQLFVRNLLDESGFLSTYYFSGLAQTAILQPRTVGILATTHF